MAKRSGLLSELWGFMREYKAYWLVPVIVAILLLGGLLILGATPAGAFIYTLF